MQLGGDLLLLLAIITTGAEALFTPNQQLVYQYHAIVQAGTSVPSLASSKWDLKGKLTVQALQDTAVLQLSELTTSLYNGKPDKSSKHTFQPIPSEVTELLQPFKVHYENNKIKSITVAEVEHLWSINIKRGIATLFQLDESQFSLKAFETEENTLYGECRTEYSINEESGKIIARKFINVNTESCKGFPKLGWSNISPDPCANTPQAVSSGVGRIYTLVPTEGGDLNLERIRSRGETNVQPFQTLGEAQFAIVNQNVVLESNENIGELLKVSESSKKIGLTFEYSKSDITQGRSPINNKDALKMSDLYLDKLSDSIEANPFLTEPDKLHDQYVAQLLYYLSLLDKSSLEQYYQRLAIGTSYYQETLRNLFLKLLPQVGSDVSVLFIQDLVLKIKDNGTAIELLTVLPFYVRQPSEKLLEKSEKLLSLGDNVDPIVKSTAVLSFATLIHMTCRRGCQPATLDNYIRKFVDLFSASTSYEEQILYLEALNNIELGDVFEYIEPIIRGNITVFTKQPHHIRFLAVWATMTSAYNPYKTSKIAQTYWPILTNRSEHLEMRVAALTMLILSRPSQGNFFSLLWFMESEPNSHLQHFFYTTLVSLTDTKYPCYVALGALASQIIRFVKPPSTSNWATGNYILDYADSQYGFGGMGHLFAVANQRTGNPNILHLVLGSYAHGYTLQRLELYLKLEGVGVIAQQNPESLNQVLELLKQLKAPIITSEPIHIEIIVKIEGKVTSCQYINEKNLNKLSEALNQAQNLIREFFINYQIVRVPFLVESSQPIDIGVPLHLRLDSSIFFLLRGNFTRDTNISPFTRRNQVDLRYSVNAAGSVIIYNPIHNLWHGAKRSHNYQSYIPINHHITLLNNPWQIRISFIKPADLVSGFLSHVQSSVDVRGSDSSEILKRFCPSCQANAIVHENDGKDHSYGLLSIPVDALGIHAGVSIFNCGHIYDSADFLEVIERIVEEDNKNYRVLPPVKYLLGFTHIADLLLLAPPHGSCGLKLQLASSDQEDTEIEVMLSFKKDQQSSGAKQELNVNLANKIQGSKTSLHEWNIGIIHTTSQENTRQNFKLKLFHSFKGNQDYKLCLDSEARFPKADDGVLLPWTPSEPATAKLNFIWSNSVEKSNKCPQEGLEISVTATGEITEEQQALMNSTNDGIRGTCWREHAKIAEWGVNHTPITGACYRASYELATLRRYDATIKYKNIPKNIVAASTRAEALLEVMHPGIISSIKDSNLNVSLEVPVSESDVKLTINDKQIYVHHAKSWIQPLLVNTRFSRSLPLSMKLSLIGSCVVNSAQVISFDGATNSFGATHCYTLIEADCTSQSKFAVLAKKIADNKLAVKVLVDKNEIEIIPAKNGKLQVFNNGQLLKLSGKNYQHLSNSKKQIFKVQRVDDGQVRVTTPEIWVQHNGPFIILVSYAWQKGQLCGLCGDFNGDISNDKGLSLSLPC